MNKGFSITKVIIVLFFITALGVGGYYGYTNYIAPTLTLNPNTPFIPTNLQEYAQGENAEIFLIFNDENSQFSSLLKNLDIPEESDIKLKSALVLVNYSLKCGSAALEFESSDATGKFKEILKEKLKNTEKEKITVNQKDKILTVSINDNGNCLRGNLKDNPLFKSLDPKYEDNQIVFAVNNEELSTLTMMLSGSMNTILRSSQFQSSIQKAHAQIIQSSNTPTIKTAIPSKETNDTTTKLMNILPILLNSTTGYLKLEDSKANLTIKIRIMDKKSLEESAIFKRYFKTGIDEFYEDMDKIINEDLNKKFEEMKKNNGKTNSAHAHYENGTIAITVNFDIKDLKNSPSSPLSPIINGPSQARDTSRMDQLELPPKLK